MLDPGNANEREELKSCFDFITSLECSAFNNAPITNIAILLR